ncbi:hypothetical protein ACWC5C_38265 [Streptomyces sp. NPDC001700]
MAVERELQSLIEANMEAMLGIRFLATEYRTGGHRGRVDSLRLDENGTPVIIKCKRSKDQNVCVGTTLALDDDQRSSLEIFKRVGHGPTGHIKRAGVADRNVQRDSS